MQKTLNSKLTEDEIPRDVVPNSTIPRQYHDALQEARIAADGGKSYERK